MATLTRKQREIEAREELILGVARSMLIERGYIGLTMDRIAAAIEYSKGTIYQHFKNKEDLVMALSVGTARQRADLFERAATFRGNTRERMLAVGVAYRTFIQLYPDHFRSEQLIHANSVRAKASDAQVDAMDHCGQRCAEITSGVVRDAVSQGDLVLPDGVAPASVTFGLWSLSFGAYFNMSSDYPLEAMGIDDAPTALQLAFQALLDGWGWRPLSTDPDATYPVDRILSEVFPDELRRLQQHG